MYQTLIKYEGETGAKGIKLTTECPEIVPKQMVDNETILETSFSK